MTATREIKLLKLLDHENIIKIIDIVASKEGVSLVFEYFEHDLSGLLQHPGLKLEVGQVKHIIGELLKALEYIHKRKIVHRDLKTSNILIGASGQIKLADFGLAKSMLHPDVTETDSTTRIMTNRVCTLWYRPPELLLGASSYGPEVDMWGVGCILVELFLLKPLFVGADNSELSQIEALFKRYTPSEISELKSYPWAGLVDFTKLEKAAPLKEFLSDKLDSQALDLALRLLHLDPSQRISAKEALSHPFMTGGPKAEPKLPILDGDWHEFECKQRRRESRNQSKINSSTK